MIEILNIEQDIVSLENRISNLMKKYPPIVNIQGIKQFHILVLQLDYNKYEFKKEIYSDHAFLYHLEPDYYDISLDSRSKKKEKYLRTMTLLTDSNGNFITISDARSIYHSSILFDIKLSKMLLDKEFDYVLSLYSPHTIDYMVGIKGNTLFAIEIGDELRIYTWDEFMECRFDKWICWSWLDSK